MLEGVRHADPRPVEVVPRALQPEYVIEPQVRQACHLVLQRAKIHPTPSGTWSDDPLLGARRAVDDALPAEALEIDGLKGAIENELRDGPAAARSI